MKKAKTFANIRFPVEVMRELINAFDQLAMSSQIKWKPLVLRVNHPDAEWTYDDVDEFLADYRIQSGEALLDLQIAYPISDLFNNLLFKENPWVRFDTVQTDTVLVRIVDTR